MLKIYKTKKYYYVKGNDIFVIKYLLNYNIKNNKIYFRKVSKVKNTLDKNNVNYILENKVNIYYDNNYCNILNKYLLINSINTKLITLIERRKFNRIINYINE